MKIQSVLVWPKHSDGGPCLGWSEDCENSSEDTHHSPSAAKSVCETLIFEGFGCDRQIFPIEARVEIDGKAVWRWTKEKGWRDVECEDPSIFEEKDWVSKIRKYIGEDLEPNEEWAKVFDNLNKEFREKEFIIKLEPRMNIDYITPTKFDHPNAKTFSNKKSQRQLRRDKRRCP